MFPAKKIGKKIITFYFSALFCMYGSRKVAFKNMILGDFNDVLNKNFL